MLTAGGPRRQRRRRRRRRPAHRGIGGEQAHRRGLLPTFFTGARRRGDQTKNVAPQPLPIAAIDPVRAGRRQGHLPPRAGGNGDAEHAGVGERRDRRRPFRTCDDPRPEPGEQHRVGEGLRSLDERSTRSVATSASVASAAWQRHRPMTRRYGSAMTNEHVFPRGSSIARRMGQRRRSRPDPLVTRITIAPITAVGQLFDELELNGEVLDVLVSLILALPDSAWPSGSRSG